MSVNQLSLLAEMKEGAAGDSAPEEARPGWSARIGYAMKVVLFCGGLGLRMREASERTPKPMVPVGNRPILWHLMKYYAHFGHTEFILCLG